MNLTVGSKNVNKQYLMEGRIRQLESKGNYKQVLKATCKVNRVNCRLLNGLTLRKMEKIYKRTLTHYENNPLRAEATWFENQLRLLQWFLIIESTLLETPLNLFNQENWTRVQAFFYPKPTIMLEFECRRLLSKADAEFHIVWCEEESLILLEILQDRTLFGRWNEVSRRLFEISRKRFYRSGKQCREQWFNHLDNSKKHGEWQEEEDEIILREVLARGHRWAEICKEFLAHRTQHMVKNRFKSLLIKHERPKQKWNAHQRKSIKKTLSKLLSVKKDGRSNGDNSQKGKLEPYISQQARQSLEQASHQREERRKEISLNCLSSDNKLMQEGKQQNQKNGELLQLWSSQDFYLPRAANSPPGHYWQNGLFPSPFFENRLPEYYWGHQTQFCARYPLTAWQPFGYMI